MSEPNIIKTGNDPNIDAERVKRFVEEFKTTMDVERFTDREKKFAMTLLGIEVLEMEVCQPIPCREHGLHNIRVEIAIDKTYEEMCESLGKEKTHKMIEILDEKMDHSDMFLEIFENENPEFQQDDL